MFVIKKIHFDGLAQGYCSCWTTLHSCGHSGLACSVIRDQKWNTMPYDVCASGQLGGNCRLTRVPHTMWHQAFIRDLHSSLVLLYINQSDIAAFHGSTNIWWSCRSKRQIMYRTLVSLDWINGGIIICTEVVTSRRTITEIPFVTTRAIMFITLT